MNHARFFFVHIRKTAGTALRRRLINHFGELAVYPTRGVDGADPVKLMLSVDHLRRRLAARRDQIRVVTCHVPLCAVDQLDGPFTTLTLLRDPVERTLSSLRDERKTHASARQRSLEEIYDAGGPFTQLRHNQMTKVLALTPAENARMAKALSLTPAEMARDARRLEVDRSHLDRAKERLAGIDAFGLQERLEDFCDELTARFGWELGEPERANATAPVEVSDGFRARLAEDNALDIELYEFAKRLLASREPEVVAR